MAELALLQPFLTRPLSPSQLSQLQAYLDLLLRWNAKMSLTAVRDPKEIVLRHFGESLFAGEHLGPVPAPSTLVDLGSGPGFPGLPIKILRPELQVTLIESRQKKIIFLREVVRTLGLENVNIHAGRAEEFRRKAQIVTMRAVEHFEEALPVAASLVDSDGWLALLIGQSQAEVVHKRLTNFSWREPIAIPRSRERIILVGLRSQAQ